MYDQLITNYLVNQRSPCHASSRCHVSHATNQSYSIQLFDYKIQFIIQSARFNQYASLRSLFARHAIPCHARYSSAMSIQELYVYVFVDRIICDQVIIIDDASITMPITHVKQTRNGRVIRERSDLHAAMGDEVLFTRHPCARTPKYQGRHVHQARPASSQEQPVARERCCEKGAAKYPVIRRRSDFACTAAAGRSPRSSQQPGENVRLSAHSQQPMRANGDLQTIHADCTRKILEAPT